MSQILGCSVAWILGLRSVYRPVQVTVDHNGE